MKILDILVLKGYYIRKVKGLYIMDKIPFLRLWDTYRGLLTPTQQEITDMYFNLDLTPSEIAEEKGITRQGVYDCLKICEKQLEDYESKLRFSAVLTKMCLETSFLITDIAKWAEAFKAENPQFAGDIERLDGILCADYSGEAEKILSDPEKVKILNCDCMQKNI